MTGAGGRWRAGLKPGIVDEASFPDCIAERFPTNAFFLTRFSHLYLPVFPSLPPCLPPTPSPTQPHCLDFLLPFGPGLNFSSLSLSLLFVDGTRRGSGACARAISWPVHFRPLSPVLFIDQWHCLCHCLVLYSATFRIDSSSDVSNSLAADIGTHQQFNSHPTPPLPPSKLTFLIGIIRIPSRAETMAGPWPLICISGKPQGGQELIEPLEASKHGFNPPREQPFRPLSKRPLCDIITPISIKSPKEQEAGSKGVEPTQLSHQSHTSIQTPQQQQQQQQQHPQKKPPHSPPT